MIDPLILKRAQSWLDGKFDETTRVRVREMMNDPAELTDSFYRNLEFGTGGLRGIMGAGTNRMNRYTVGMATQGLANYVTRMFPGVPLKAAVSFDSRNNSRDFARIVAEVLSMNGFVVYLFDDLRPTPELSFAIRYLHCQTGVMLTASHNPKEYNGYKAYWDDGAQMISPHDVNVITEVNKITSIEEVRWNGVPEKIIPIGKEVDEAYLGKVLRLSLSPDTVARQNALKIVYTPLHGCGRILVPEILRRYGFTNITTIGEQMVPDGNFPTVRSPNPEERDAMDMAIRKAREIGADLVMATDPDADRVGIALKNPRGEYILLNGNQTAAILFYYILKRRKDKGLMKENDYIVSTIVTTELLKDIATRFGVGYFECLTGFKFIADVIRRNEGKLNYIVGGEESFGYLIGDFVRDKDSVSACALIAEAAAWMADQGKTMYDLLMTIYRELGLYKEHLISVTKKGKEGSEEIQAMMVNYREHPPESINSSRVLRIRDYLTLKEKEMISGTTDSIALPKSNVLQFLLEDGSKISVRPSGTEPKIKFYFSVKCTLEEKDEYETKEALLSKKISDILNSMKLQ